jgi:hypothetical protein
MSVGTESAAARVQAAKSVGLARLRRGSFAILVLVVVQYAIGMYVNIYVSVPAADHGRGLGSDISNGPGWLSVHVVLGLLLGLGALGLLTQAVLIRHWGVVVASAVGLLSLILASVAGAGFASTGDNSASMAMAVLTGVAVLCYGATPYLPTRAGIQRG